MPARPTPRCGRSSEMPRGIRGEAAALKEQRDHRFAYGDPYRAGGHRCQPGQRQGAVDQAKCLAESAVKLPRSKSSAITGLRMAIPTAQAATDASPANAKVRSIKRNASRNR